MEVDAATRTSTINIDKKLYLRPSDTIEANLISFQFQLLGVENYQIWCTTISRTSYVYLRNLSARFDFPKFTTKIVGAMGLLSHGLEMLLQRIW